MANTRTRAGGGRPRGSGGGRGGRRGGRGSGPGGSKGGGPKVHVEELHPIDTPPDIERFTEWDLAPWVLEAIESMGITTPTPVQKLAIGPVLEGRDVIAKAETGTGKTLAFGAPMMSKIDAVRSTVLGLVLCPTRELAQQVQQVLQSLGEPKGIRTCLLVGGDPIQPQVAELRKGCQVVVGTPGRVLDLMGQRFLSFPWTEFVVLDEADEMLEIGFLDDVEKILDQTPEERQTLLFSATFPPALLALARKHTREPAELATAKGVATVDNIRQSVVFCSSEDDRTDLLRSAIRRSSNDDLMLVFCDRRTDVDKAYRRLERLPEGVKALHGGFDQAARFRVMGAFREGSVRALLATDVASRGLDVRGVTHVVNCGVPREVSTYTHRIGRTGRAGSTGRAITLVAPADKRRWRELVSHMNWDVEELEPGEFLRTFGGAPPQRRGEAAVPQGTEGKAAVPQGNSGGRPRFHGGTAGEGRVPQGNSGEAPLPRGTSAPPTRGGSRRIAWRRGERRRGSTRRRGRRRCARAAAPRTLGATSSRGRRTRGAAAPRACRRVRALGTHRAEPRRASRTFGAAAPRAAHRTVGRGARRAPAAPSPRTGRDRGSRARGASLRRRGGPRVLEGARGAPARRARSEKPRRERDDAPARRDDSGGFGASIH
ncbi:MAG: DEAD/DEAH box helicase [Planctomycetota bacterium]